MSFRIGLQYYAFITDWKVAYTIRALNYAARDNALRVKYSHVHVGNDATKLWITSPEICSHCMPTADPAYVNITSSIDHSGSQILFILQSSFLT